MTEQDLTAMRTALAGIPEGVASQASQPPPADAIFAPDKHGDALDPDRALVVGNRGVGKSFWSSVLADTDSRQRVAHDYPRLGLDRMDVQLGFHEAAGKVDGPAPSALTLADLIRNGHDPTSIWSAVLLRALPVDLALPDKMADLIAWSGMHGEDIEAALRQIDDRYVQERKRFVLVFDALDRLGSDWATVRRLSEGILRLALDARGYRALRVKVFMRTDQAKDDVLFRFPDASKIRTAKVDLVWRRRDLFGLLYATMWRNANAGEAFRRLATGALPTLSLRTDLAELPDTLKNDEQSQEIVFAKFAGKYMGTNRRRGKTYAWVHGHLADADGETSPRSFLQALKSAAAEASVSSPTVVEHAGIRVGVQHASYVRLTQLKEDYGWIQEALGALEGLEVPCTPKTFTSRWTEKTTIQKIRAQVTAREGHELGPVEIEGATIDEEAKLLVALQNIGIIEIRAPDRINVPDIFRVAGRIKRRGGVKPA